MCFTTPTPTTTTTTTGDSVLAAEWAGDNATIIQEHCQKIFIGKWENLHIAKAIQEKMRVDASADPTTKEVRKIPKNFLTLKSAAQMSEQEVLSRFNQWKSVIDIREGDDKGTDPTDGWDIDNFREILDHFRELIYAMASPVINTSLAREFNQKYPGFTFGNNRKVLTISDYVDFIHEYNPNEPGAMPMREARIMTHRVLYGFWGSGNMWAENGETKILNLLGFEYDGNRMCDGTVMKRKQRGGFIKTFEVKKLDMERTKVCDAWDRVFGEKFFHRDNFKEPKPNATGKQARKDKSHLRKYIVWCKPGTHGFEGGYLLTENNPERQKIDAMTEKETAKTPELSTAKKNPIGAPRELASTASTQTVDVAAVLSALTKEKNKKVSVEELLGLIAGGNKRPLEWDSAVVGPPPGKKPKSIVSVSSEESVVSDITERSPTSHPAPTDAVVEQVSHERSNTEEEVLLGDADAISREAIDDAVNSFENLDGLNLHEPLPQSLPASPIGKKDGNNGAIGLCDSSVSDHGQGLRSPRHSPQKLARKEGALPCNCDSENHGKLALYAQYDSTYFSKSHLSKKKNQVIPRKCFYCNKNLIGGKVKKSALTDNDFKVGTRINEQVHACPVAMRGGDIEDGTPCDHVFCDPCFTMCSTKYKFVE